MNKPGWGDLVAPRLCIVHQRHRDPNGERNSQMRLLTRMVAIASIALVLSALPLHISALADASAGAGAAPNVNSGLITIPQDTLVTLQFTDPVSTRTSEAGQKVNLRVADDVYVGTQLVIHKGETTTATLTEVRKPRSWGRSGKIGMEFGTVKAIDGTDIALGPWSKDTLKSAGYAAGATIGGAVVLGPVGLLGGLFVKGKNVDIPVGQSIVAAVRWQTTVNPAIAVVPTIPAAPSASAPPAPVAKEEQPVKPAAVAPPAPAAKTDAQGSDNASAKPAKAEDSTAKANEPKEGAKKDAGKVAPVIPIIEDVTPDSGGAKKSN